MSITIAGVVEATRCIFPTDSSSELNKQASASLFTTWAGRPTWGWERLGAKARQAKKKRTSKIANHPAAPFPFRSCITFETWLLVLGFSWLFITFVLYIFLVVQDKDAAHNIYTFRQTKRTKSGIIWGFVCHLVFWVQTRECPKDHCRTEYIYIK